MDERDHKAMNEELNQPSCLGAVMCRYSLYERKDLNSRILWNGTNKAEMKKVRTGWKYQILLTTITAEIYDNVKKEWVA
jgi:hypothetical protein